MQKRFRPLAELELLAALALKWLGEGGGAGAHIELAIRKRTRRKVNVSSVYMTLRRLKARKLLSTTASAPTGKRGGRATVLYHLTARGHAVLTDSLKVIDDMRDGI